LIAYLKIGKCRIGTSIKSTYVYVKTGVRMVNINWQRRGRVEILADILAASVDGVRGTHIMYKANLNFAQRKRYLTEALNAGLIGVRVNSPLVCATTEKGHEWLKNYRKLVDSSEAFST
jgi:predicted transcriptional regulator